MSSRRRSDRRPRSGARPVRRLALASLAVEVVAATVLGAAMLPRIAAASAPRTLHPRVATVTQDGTNGMNLTNAWTLSTGSPSITVAYIEGGINWHLGDAATLASVVSVNWKATPVPCTGTTVATATMVIGGLSQACATYYSTNQADYDPDGSGVINAAQWANDPRVTDSNHNGVIDPEDLIAAFSDGVDHAGLGYANDISGWDFYDNQNDPSIIDTAYGHANGQMDTLHTMCPKCMILPIKAGDEALDPTDNLAKAWQFAADHGANVIVSVTADLGYSPFMRQVVDELNQKGVVMLESSNDFDSTDHQGGMFWPYVIPGNGAVASPSGTEWVRSDLTSWGAHAMFTVATGGGSTSESTPTTGGVIGLLLSYGLQAYQSHLIPAPLTGQQAVQILRATATPFTDTTLGWPGTTPTAGAPDDWNEQYGYGMPNLYAAMQMVQAGQIPPAAQITSPDWYSIVDPTTSTNPVPVTGTIQASTASTTFSWQLQMGLGGQPANSAFTTIGSGTGTGSFSGTLGSLDLSTIPQADWQAAAQLSTDNALSSVDQYAVTFRLVVTDANSLTGEDRRAIDVVHDPSQLAGFPKPVDPASAGAGSGGTLGTDARASVEGSPQTADLQGSGHLDVIFADSAGMVHAIDPTTGDELPGWPVSTAAETGFVAHTGIDPGNQPVISSVAVGDLDHTGALSVVVTTLDGTVEVFDATGHLEPGWPQRVDLGVTPPAIPRPQEPLTRLPVDEAVASPVLAHLEGTAELDIVQAGGDGYLHAWRPDGTAVPGWPVKVALPTGFTPHSGYRLVDDERLVATPSLTWFGGKNPADGPGGAWTPPDLVIRSQYTEITAPGANPLPYSHVFAFGPDGQALPGWPVTVQGMVEYYGSAQDAITEGSSSTVSGDVNGSGKDVVIDSPVWTTPVEIDGSGTIVGSVGNSNGAMTSLLATLPSAGGQTNCETQTFPSGASNVPIPFTASGAIGVVGGTLSYAQAQIGALSFGCLQYPNIEQPLDNFEAVVPANAANGGASSELPGFPGPRQGQGFLTAPVIADVTGSGAASVVDGGDSNEITAVDGSGAESAGFPKFTSGWDLGGLAAADLTSNGHVDIVSGTREGYLDIWSTPGLASADTQWWSGRHDELNSGNSGVDSRPPGVLRSPSWNATARTATFVAPGDNWYDGTVDHYVVTLAPSGRQYRVEPSGPAGTSQSITVPAGSDGLSVQAVDAAGNVSPVAVFGATPPPPPPGGGGYLEVASDGGIFAFGDAGFHGSMGGKALNAPIVSIASTPDGGGYLEVASDGGIFAFGDAGFHGSMGGKALNAPIVSIASTPDGGGYWEVASDGGIFAFGDAGFHGSMGGKPLDRPIVSIASTPDGKGYWEVASDGGIFAFGDAGFHGSMGGKPLDKPIVSIASTPDGKGYWEVASDGGIFAFGDAGFHGSMGGKPLDKPIVSIASTPDGKGYWEVASDGGIFAFGDAGFHGSMGGKALDKPIVGFAGPATL